MLVLDIQWRLKQIGCDPGSLDGIWGPQTRAAVKAFQAKAGLLVDGIVGKLTTAALNAAAVPAADPAVPTPPILKPGEPIWVQEGRRRLGLQEGNPKLKAFLKSDGRTLGDPELLPWCGDFVETCIRVALPDEAIPNNPYLARNWLLAGVTCPEPVLGAIAVFWRGSKAGTSGHVGFVVGADAKYLSILGGNQSNTVSVARLDRVRLLGCRWPMTAGDIVVAAMPKPTGVVTKNEA